jgi:hypothetical protein
MTRLPAIRTSLGSFGAQTSRHSDTYLDIYQVGAVSRSPSRGVSRPKTRLSTERARLWSTSPPSAPASASDRDRRIIAMVETGQSK